MGAKVHEWKTSDGSHWAFHCPACDATHVFDKRWTWNGSVEKPTFAPSLLIHGDEKIGRPRCHSHVMDGKMAYCADSTHAMKGQSVELPDWSGIR